MTDEPKGGNKGGRWAETLEEAGLLDEIEGGWALSEGEISEGAAIEVVGKGGVDIPESVPPERASDAPASGGEAVSLGPSRDGVLPVTPIEKIKSSNPAAAVRTSAPQPPIAVPSVKQTVSGIPRTPVMPSYAPPPPEPRPSRPPAPPPEAERPTAEPERAERKPRGEKVSLDERGRRISVAPEAMSRPEEERAPSRRHSIVDDPVDPDGDRRGHARRKSIAVMRERLEVGDYTGALDASEAVIAEDPSDGEALRCRDECREVLVGMFESRIGDLGGVPRIAVSDHDLVWRNLDAQGGFVLSRIDGMSSYEDIIDISGLSRFETCRILDRLLQEGIIE